MTITLPWWSLPLVLAALGFILPPLMFKRQGDYDLGTPMLQLLVFAVLVVAAIGIVIGRLL